MLLADKVCIITGAASQRGIGRATARLFSQHGGRVVIVDLDEGQAKAAAADLGEGHLGFACNVTDKQSCLDAAQRVIGEFGRIDVLVNNAGINVPKFALDVTEEDWDRVLDVDLKGTFFLSQAVGREMVKRQSGKIINIASQMGVIGYYRRAAYCSAKAGVVNLTRVLAIEWAPYGIRVNCVGPTFLMTPLTAPMFQEEAFYQDVVSRIPLGHVGKPEDVVGAIVYLASPAADMVTGHTLLVDGGWTAW